MKRILLFLLLSFFANLAVAQHQLVVRIAHGSRPHPQHRDTEKHWLGGIYGGHVVIELDSFAYGFNFASRRVHIFPRIKSENKVGVFEKDNALALMENWSSLQVTSVFVPLSDSDYTALKAELERIHKHPDFDYAFMGMRCASTAYMLLSHVDVFEHSGQIKSMRKAFHPKALRKRLVKVANTKGYRIEVQRGYPERIWEGDKR